MSHDYTSISTERYQELQRQAQNAQRLQRENQQIRANSQERERRIASEYEASLNSIKQTINAVSTQNSAEVRRLSDDLRGRLAQQSEQLQGNILNINNRINDVVRDFNNRLSEFSNTTSEKRERAVQLVALLDDMIQTIRGLRPNKFRPGELEALEQLREDAQTQINHGDYEATIATAGEGMRTSGRLIAALKIINEEFNLLLHNVQNHLNEVQTQIESYADEAENYIEVKYEGEQVQLPFNISYWSTERFNNIINSHSNIVHELSNAATSNINIEALERIDNELARLDEEIMLCHQEGVNEMIRSTVVEDMAVRIHNVLANQGWTQQITQYTDDDKRKPYEMVYSDGSGNEVAIVVSGGKDPRTPNFSIAPYSDNEYIKENLLDWVSNGLIEQGIDVPTSEWSGTCEKSPTTRDFLRNEAQRRIILAEANRASNSTVL